VLGIAVDNNGYQAEHPRALGRDHWHRRFDRKRKFPPHVRSAPYRRVLWPRRDALVGSEPSLWGQYNQTGEFGYNVQSPDRSDVSMVTAISNGSPDRTAQRGGRRRVGTSIQSPRRSALHDEPNKCNQWVLPFWIAAINL
jgi:hypothetical protein